MAEWWYECFIVLVQCANLCGREQVLTRADMFVFGCAIYKKAAVMHAMCGGIVM